MGVATTDRQPHHTEATMQGASHQRHPGSPIGTTEPMTAQDHTVDKPCPVGIGGKVTDPHPGDEPGLERGRQLDAKNGPR